MKKRKIGLLPKVGIAITLGILLGLFFPDWAVRIFTTFNGLFSNFLGFIIPLLILGLVAPGIAELGRSAGRLLLITVALAYGFTLFSGFYTYFTCDLIYPTLLQNTSSLTIADTVEAASTAPFFNVELPPLMEVMTALMLAFTLGLGMALIKGSSLRNMMEDFRDIINKVIVGVIIPLLPVFIFGIFLEMTFAGKVASIMGVFMKIVVLIFIMTVLLLLIQFSIAGIIGKRNPLKLLKNMMPAYVTALGTQSSAATIPVTLAQTIKNKISEQIAAFVIPLCATIHLSGSTLKIVACTLAIIMTSGIDVGFAQYAGFICMLGIVMVAAPGVPGGAIMASIGIIQSMLGFNQEAVGLMIALYIAMDSFGTACNVTGDGAIAVIIDRIAKKERASL
ncbi:MAG: dicarboxylate/amino acid:cation symporter [Prevotellaceae bacterium]|jgi:Na+/H+-dicarboxylate symporter|nr:dicarboxylate/amino acid:cation symporter [Prevotellaceae bacterium]